MNSQLSQLVQLCFKCQDSLEDGLHARINQGLARDQVRIVAQGCQLCTQEKGNATQ